ncbi:phosphoribosyltransferase-like protein [Vibrio parahaemolyticus]|uniref:phosphoribosyltransferase-like protein n=1 Tax=Vibrio parahaemolyticus TaxID=670 RepID=UPI0003F9C0B9|nr:hypothetical protein [Vibrio parahaemolyticus]
MNKAYLCSEIASIIANYASGQFGLYDGNHVWRWVEQFEDSEQQIVLEETLHILQRNYISRDKFINFATDAINCEGLHKGNPVGFWSNASILNIQIDGNSQSELNDIFGNVLHSQLGIYRNHVQHSDTYLYIDDFIFSGNRLYSDVAKWVADHQPSNCTIYFITIGYYQYGEYSLKNRLKELFAGRNIQYDIFSYSDFRLENRLRYRERSDRLWPTEAVRYDPSIDTYLQNNRINFPFRTGNGELSKVFSSARRYAFEEIMLKYGIYIVGLSAHNSVVVKPLGYDTFPNSLGFGSTVFTFRNCPNNNPLPFWWGDPNSTNPTLRRWYPLMQRRVYNV